MIKASTKINMNTASLARKAKWAMASPLQKAASLITRSAKGSIKKSAKKYSAPGQPPYTRGGQRSLKKSIMYHVDKVAGQAIAGPAGFVTGLTGHYHEFGGVQALKGKRKHYQLGGIGPITKRSGYTTPRGNRTGSSRPSDAGIVFAPLKTPKMVMRARALDHRYWPDAEKLRRRIYKQRPFMWPAVQKNHLGIIKLFSNSIK